MKRRSSASVLFVVGRRAFLAAHADEPVAIDSADPSEALIKARSDEEGAGRAIIVWEPFGMTHARVDCPTRVDRKTFAALADVTREHPVVTAENQGWGIETPRADGGTVKTWLHAETVPELSGAVLPISEGGSSVAAAWSLATVVFAAMDAAKLSRVIVAAPPFIGIFIEGRRGMVMRSQCVVSNLDDAPARGQAYDVLQNSGLLDPKLRAQWHIYGTFTDVAGLAEALASNTSEHSDAFRDAITGMQRHEWEELEEHAVKLRTSHPANLWHTFPRPYPLGRVLRYCAAGLAIAALTFGGFWWNESRQASAEAAQARQLATTLRQNVEHNEQNKAKYEQIVASSGIKGVVVHKAREEALRALAAAVPDSFTLERFALTHDNQVSARVLRIDSSATNEALAREWQRAGFSWDLPTQGDEKPDAASKAVSISGRLLLPSARVSADADKQGKE